MSACRALGLVALGLAGCSTETLMAIDVRTDLEPGVHFASARVDLVESSDDTGRSSRSAEKIARTGETTWRTGRRIAELGLPRGGEWIVDGELLDSAGAPVATATVRVDVREGETTTTTLVFSPDCGTECPDAGPADAGPTDAAFDTGSPPDAGPTGTVSGSVVFVNASASTTSIILVDVSRFVPGAPSETPPDGLRADVSAAEGAFAIAGTAPATTYVVLAAYENDGLVADPGDPGSRPTITTDAGGSAVLSDTLRVTNALEVIRPGAAGVEIVAGLTITFQWADDASEDHYELEVVDSSGALIFEDRAIPGVSTGDVTYDWKPAPPPVRGELHQFRVWSISASGERIGVTEDMRGLFRPAP